MKFQTKMQGRPVEVDYSFADDIYEDVFGLEIFWLDTHEEMSEEEWDEWLSKPFDADRVRIQRECVVDYESTVADLNWD